MSFSPRPLMPSEIKPLARFSSSLAAISFCAALTALSAANPRISFRAAASAWAIYSCAAAARRAIWVSRAMRESFWNCAASDAAASTMARASASAPAARF